MTQSNEDKKGMMLSFVFDEAVLVVEIFIKSLINLKKSLGEQNFEKVEDILIRLNSDTWMLSHNILHWNTFHQNKQLYKIGLEFVRDKEWLRQATDDIFNVSRTVGVISKEYSKKDLFTSHIELCLSIVKNKKQFTIDVYKKWILENSNFFMIEKYSSCLNFDESSSRHEFFKNKAQESYQNSKSTYSFDEEKAIMNAIKQGEGDKFGY